MANGDLLILGAKRRDHVNLVAYGGPRNATVLDGVAEELTRTGRVVWSWNSRGHIALSESRHWLPYILRSPIRMPDGRRAYDLVHLNSADQDGSTIVLSARHADAVYAVSRATGEVAWKVADRVMQIFGGYGYAMDFPVQRGWRDSRLIRIGGGTDEIMREVIGRLEGL